MLSTCMHVHSQSLSPLIDGPVRNILLQTARHQQGAAWARWCNKTYACWS